MELPKKGGKQIQSQNTNYKNKKEPLDLKVDKKTGKTGKQLKVDNQKQKKNQTAKVDKNSV